MVRLRRHLAHGPAVGIEELLCSEEKPGHGYPGNRDQPLGQQFREYCAAAIGSYGKGTIHLILDRFEIIEDWAVNLA
ncbi:hypothetical protein D3C78_1052340 [compost metagenome]